MIDTFSFLLHDFKIGFTNEWSVCMHLRGDWQKTKLNWNDNGLFKCIGRLPPECKLFRKCWRSERSWIYSGLWSNIYNSNLSFQIIHDDRCLIGESIGCVVSLHHFVSPILFVRVGHKCSLFVFFFKHWVGWEWWKFSQIAFEKWEMFCARDIFVCDCVEQMNEHWII